MKPRLYFAVPLLHFPLMLTYKENDYITDLALINNKNKGEILNIAYAKSVVIILLVSMSGLDNLVQLIAAN